MDKGRLKIFQILDFLEKLKSVFLGRRGKSPPLASKASRSKNATASSVIFFALLPFPLPPPVCTA